jgi:hypothetical protein
LTSDGSRINSAAKLGTDRWEGEGLEVCGYCFCEFSDGRPPHRVVMVREEQSGTCRYSEDRPWHQDCIELKNAEIAALSHPIDENASTTLGTPASLRRHRHGQ